ncbi:GLPGLI family protein [Halosquirtibacter laminarini]|uniref:GLPGLI family protein n=1 Tax=Halosquirtibacter laminarini TaxID=3374600 RepID=A0AC61NNE2_9BACT|nr:GLPGLI family protein [Prolixibacteraceae bacterium]
MKKQLFFFIILTISNSLKAKDIVIIDTTKVSFYYDYTFVKDTNNITELSHDDMVLQVGSHCARFSHLFEVELDSACYKYRDYTFEEQYKYIKDVFTLTCPSKFSYYRLYKNYPKVREYSMEFLSNKSFIRTQEPMDKIWSLEEAKDTTIMGHSCSLATCHYAGRDYRAWYTLDIPISFGPYKFDGLPGLVMRVEDSEKQHVFQLYKIGKRKRKMFYVEQDNEIKANPEELCGIFRNNIQQRYRQVTGGKKLQFDDPSMNARLANYVISYNNFIERY